MITDLENIKVEKLFSLGDKAFSDYARLQKVLKPKPEFLEKEAVEITSLTFGQVNQMKRIFAEPTFEGIFESFEYVFAATKKEVLTADVVSYFYAFNHIAHQVQKVIIKEKVLEVNDEEEKFLMKEAGVKRLHAFQELPVLISFAERFSCRPEDIEEWKYSTVFSILLYDKILAEVRKKKDELKKAMKPK